MVQSPANSGPIHSARSAYDVVQSNPPGGAVYLRKIGVGHLFFALGFAVIGAISLAARDFLLYQEPVPQGIPWRETLALISAALLLIPGIGLLLPATAKRSALILTAFVALWVAALEIPRALAHPLIEVNWLGVGEDTSAVAGGWLIYCAIARRSNGSVRIAQIVFGVGLVPTWMPLRTPLTALGGAGHIAAGLALAFAIVPRLAATLEVIKETLFTVICWVSAVVVTPTDRQ